MNNLQIFLQDNFYLINGVIGILFIFIYGLLLTHLVGHMREMVRLKYHVDKRAEFDESRVKIVIGVIMFLTILYTAIWIYSTMTLNIAKYEDFLKASAMFKAISTSLLIGAYAVYFINNRIKGDIKHIKRTVRTNPDESQQAFNHL